MKSVLLVLACAAVLGGCAVVPAYGPPGFYAPAVVVPYGGYYGGHHRGGHGHHGYGHRGYR